MFAEDAQKTDQHKHAADGKWVPDAAGFAGLKEAAAGSEGSKYTVTCFWAGYLFTI